MRRRKRLAKMDPSTIVMLTMFLLTFIWLLKIQGALMLETSCLNRTLGCHCTWKDGKFVANCTSLGLSQMPVNDHGLNEQGKDNEIFTLRRDIQQLDLKFNNITSLDDSELFEKNFGNLQKIYLQFNRIVEIHPKAFHKMIGLIELDLSDNLIPSLSQEQTTSDHPSEASLIGGSSAKSSSLVKLPVEADKRLAANLSSSQQTQRHQESKSFISELASLRVLRLASNKIQTVEEFAFSPLVRLHQLYLSRNLIHYIDKRAFDGLDQLNILHLELIHLEGAILLRLPQLYGVQLGGASNEWRCDCRLRKLVRALGRHSLGPGAQMDASEPLASSSSILQDEPQCAASVKTVAGKTTGSSHRTNWKSMKITEFQCPPKLVSQFMGSSVDSHNSVPDQDHPGDDVESLENDGKPPAFVHRYLAGEPIEITCAHQMTDELDIEAYRLEWLVASDQRAASSRKDKWTPLWSSSSASSSLSSASTVSAPASASSPVVRSNEPASQAADIDELKSKYYTIIDYVTRANQSGQQDSVRDTNLSLLRLSHLIISRAGIDIKPPGLKFMCRITDQLGQRQEAVHLVSIDPGVSRKSVALWKRRLQMRQLAVVQATAKQLVNAGNHGLSPEDKIRLAVRAFDDGKSDQVMPLFVPLHLPQMPLTGGRPPDLLMAAQCSIGTGGACEQYQRTLTRQINGTERSSQGKQETKPSHGPDQQLIETIALSLIGRFTSNRDSLMVVREDANDSDEDGDTREVDLADQLIYGGTELNRLRTLAGGHPDGWQSSDRRQMSSTTYRAIVKQLNLDKWYQWLIEHYMLLLGLFCCLLVGSLLLGFLLFTHSKLSVRRRVVASASGQICKPDKPIPSLDEGYEFPVNLGNSPNRLVPVASAASSSSTRTNESHRKLISSSPEVSGDRAITTGFEANPCQERLLDPVYGAILAEHPMEGSSYCQSDEGADPMSEYEDENHQLHHHHQHYHLDQKHCPAQKLSTHQTAFLSSGQRPTTLDRGISFKQAAGPGFTAFRSSTCRRPRGRLIVLEPQQEVSLSGSSDSPIYSLQLPLSERQPGLARRQAACHSALYADQRDCNFRAGWRAPSHELSFNWPTTATDCDQLLELAGQPGLYFACEPASSSITSPQASTSSCSVAAHSSSTQQIHGPGNSNPDSMSLVNSNNNDKELVYLEDAIQLLASSMGDSLLVSPQSGTYQNRQNK